MHVISVKDGWICVICTGSRIATRHEYGRDKEEERGPCACLVRSLEHHCIS